MLRGCLVRLAAIAVTSAAEWTGVAGSDSDLAGIPQLGLLLIIFAGLFFVPPFAAETMLRLHDD